MTKTNKKIFDCVEMMHQGGARVREELSGKSPEEKLAYWVLLNEEARREYPRIQNPSMDALAKG